MGLNPDSANLSWCMALSVLCILTDIHTPSPIRRSDAGGGIRTREPLGERISHYDLESFSVGLASVPLHRTF